MSVPLARQRNFRNVWAASSLSSIGTQVSAIALPLVALLALHASTFQVSALTAVEALPQLLIGLPTGAWVDRMRRRPLLVAMDVIRAAALAVVPLCALAHVLSIGVLYLSGFVVGAATIVFDVGGQAFLPSIVERDQLAAANGQMQTIGSVSYAVGPAIGGFLVQVFTAPYAIAFDALSYVWSAGWIGGVRVRETRPERGPERRSLRADIMAGVRVITDDFVLRAIATYNAFSVLFLGAERAIEMVFLVRVVRISAGSIGILTGVASVGAVLGGLCSRAVIKRLGHLRVMFLTATVGNAFMLLVPLTAHGPRVVLYAVGVGVTSFGIVMFNVASITYRQLTVPDRMLGRMGATMRFVSSLLLPVGALAGGGLAVGVGPRDALWVSAVGGILAATFLVPLRRARPLPAGGPTGTDAPAAADGAGADNAGADNVDADNAGGDNADADNADLPAA